MKGWGSALELILECGDFIVSLRKSCIIGQTRSVLFKAVGELLPIEVQDDEIRDVLILVLSEFEHQVLPTRIGVILQFCSLDNGDLGNDKVLVEQLGERRFCVKFLKFHAPWTPRSAEIYQNLFMFSLCFADCLSYDVCSLRWIFGAGSSRS